MPAKTTKTDEVPAKRKYTKRVTVSNMTDAQFAAFLAEVSKLREDSKELARIKKIIGKV